MFLVCVCVCVCVCAVIVKKTYYDIKIKNVCKKQNILPGT